jgi:methenyltetrahydromethanopterin cyclohydrolase
VTLNERAMRLADHMAMNAATLRITVSQTAEARILDCGIASAGGLQAGLTMARVCLGGQADVALVPGVIGHVAAPHVQVTTDQPIIACMAAQYAGWQIAVGKFFAMGSGPMRAHYGKEELYNVIAGRERAPVAVGVLETRKPPDEAVIEYLSQHLELPASQLTLLIAPSASIAGTMQVVARSLETALHKLHTLGFDLGKVVSGMGIAPLPPVAHDELHAIGRTNDAILYGGQAVLWVRADDKELSEIGPRVPSSSSPDFGVPFATLFERYNRDFYKIDPMLFSPAQIVFNNLNSGVCHVFGRLEPDVLAQSFQRVFA